MRAVRSALVAIAVIPLVLMLPANARAEIFGAAWIVVDASSGEVLAADNPDRVLPPASLTKMVTAQVVADRAEMDDVIRISRAVATAEADRVRWPLGMQFTVEDVLHGLLMESSNGAAIALAEHVAGSTKRFATLMNEKARSLGATSSTFVNPHGLDAPGQVASPRDLATIARGLLRVPVLRDIVRTRSYKLTWQGGLTTFYNNTRFLSQYPGAIGIKPGYTTRAGNCLAAAAVRGGKTLLAVVMSSTSVTEDAAALIDDGWRRLGIAEVPDQPDSQPGTTASTRKPADAADLEPAPLAPSGQAVARAPLRVADSRVPSPAGTMLVFAVSGLVTVKRRKARAVRRVVRPARRAP